jgi:hypothetical protein
VCAPGDPHTQFDPSNRAGKEIEPAKAFAGIDIFFKKVGRRGWNALAFLS